jgi:hypothetical protein
MSDNKFTELLLMLMRTGNFSVASILLLARQRQFKAA